MSYVSQPSRSSISKTLFLTSAITTVGFLSFTTTAQAVEGLPSNGFVVNGSATLDYSQNDQLHVNATTDFVSINWNDFNIDAGHLTQFHQTSSSAMAVNRVVGAGADPTKILGTLKSNGIVMVLDRNGVIFGQDSVVDVGGIIASTGDVSDADILDDGKFEFSNFGSGELKLEGSITVAEAGLAAFVSPNVTNSGVIKAKMGRVALAAGDKVTLDLYGDNLVEIAVDDKLADGLIKNTGTIEAEGGEVIVTTQIAKAAVDNVINMKGNVKVTSATVQGGKIILSGGSQGKVKVKGDIRANGKNGQSAGSIDITGEAIEITQNAEVKARGKNGGNAGDINIIADKTLTINGLISATGAEGTGFIETSAPTTTFGVNASILANREWLLDPTDVVVDAAMETLIEGQLAIGGMTVETPAAGTDDGNIDLNVVIDWATDKIFKLIADGNVNINGTGGINATGAGSFEAIAGNDVDVQGDITTQGGNVSLTAGDTASQDDVIIEAAITTNGGNFDALAGDDVFVRDAVSTGGGNVTLSTRDNAGTSTISVISTGSVDSGNGDITINSDSINLSTSGPATKLNAGTGTVAVDRVSEGVITLGTGAAYGDLTQGELGTISAAKLVLGDADAATSKTTTINVTDVVLNTIPTVELNALATATNAVNFAGTNSFLALNAKANEINVTGGSTAGTSIHFDAPTTNLNGDLVSAAITGTSTTVNVQSDAAQIQDGVDVAATGATVNVAAGTFAETVNVGKTLSLLGANAGTAGNDAGRVAESIIESPDNGINVTANGVTVDGFTVDGAKATTGSNGIEVTAADGFTAQNNIIQGYTDTGSGRAKSGYKSGIGILIDNSTGTINISDNVIDKNTDGVRVLDTDATAVGDVLVTKNDVTNNGDKGIIINRSDRAQVTNNNATKNSFGIWLENSDNVLVNTNTVKDSTQVGIRIRNQADSNIIRGNTIDGAGAEGILADQNSDTLRIVDNDIDNTKTAIELDGANNSVIRGNDIGLIGGANNIDGEGISSANALGVRLIDNDIQNTTSNGIGIDASDNAVVAENRLNNIGDDGIDFDGVTNTVVRDNRVGTQGGVDNIAEDGIDISGGSNIRLVRNRIKNTVQSGVDTFQSDELVLRDNIIRDTGENGAEIEQGNKVTFIDNTVTDTGADGINTLRTDEVVARDNTVRRTGRDGMDIRRADKATIVDNTITDTARRGIFAQRINGTADPALIIRDNTVKDTRRNAIVADRFTDALIVDNTVRDSRRSGIVAKNGDTLNARRNDVRDVNRDGFFIEDVDAIELVNNDVRRAGWDAAHIDGFETALIERNDVRETGDDGLEAINGDKVTIFDNFLRKIGFVNAGANADFAGADAVSVENVSGDDAVNKFSVDIQENDIKRTYDDAIDVAFVGRTIIKENTIKHVGGDNTGDFGGADVFGADGIFVVGAIDSKTGNRFDLKINKNTIDNTADDAIQSLLSGDTQVNKNTITNAGTSAGAGFTGGDGINIFSNFLEETRVSITKNEITGAEDDGIEVIGASDLTVDKNIVDGSGDDGINILGFNSFNGVTLLSSYDAVVTNNVVTNSGTDGIQSEGFTTALIETNQVSDSAEIGINVSGFNNGTTTVSDNTLTDNDIGLQFESGVADLTGAGNTFEGGRVGIRFASYDLAQPSLSSFIFRPGTGFADISLVDDDGSEGFDGTIGAQTFDDQDLYVELANGALFEPGQPGIYNALDSTYLNTPFGDVTPSADFLPDGFTAAQIEYFESKFTHFVDDNSLGLFFFPPDIDQERIFDQFDPANLGISGLNVTILGLPSLPGNVGAALNNIATFAGNGDGADELAGLTPEQLNDIDTAAGGESTTCWTDAINNAENGITTDMEFTGTAEDLLRAESSCSL